MKRAMSGTAARIPPREITNTEVNKPSENTKPVRESEAGGQISAAAVNTYADLGMGRINNKIHPAHDPTIGRWARPVIKENVPLARTRPISTTVRPPATC